MNKMMLNLFMFLVCVLLAILNSTLGVHRDGPLTEYCQNKFFSPSCQRDEVIEMQTALYGSIRLGKCIQEDVMGKVGCISDVLGIADKQCSGRRSCEIHITNEEMDNARVCENDLSRYFEAAYRCLKVLIPPQRHCASATAITVTTKPAYLSSEIAKDTNCGLTGTPWILDTKNGQQLDLTLTNYNWGEMSKDDSADCGVKLGYMFDVESGEIVNLCASTNRTQHIHATKGSQLQILLDKTILDTYNFIIKYQAVGCPTMKLPVNTWSKLDSGELTIGCNDGPEKWTMNCRGNHWIGFMKNCTRTVSTEPAPNQEQPVDQGPEIAPENHEHHFLVIIVVASVTAVGILVVIIIGVICIKRLNSTIKSHTSTELQDYRTYGHSNNVRDSSYLPVFNPAIHGVPMATLTSGGYPIGGQYEHQNGTLLNNAGSMGEPVQYFVLDKDFINSPNN